MPQYKDVTLDCADIVSQQWEGDRLRITLRDVKINEDVLLLVNPESIDFQRFESDIQNSLHKISVLRQER